MKRAFTLMELVLVIVVVGIISAVMVPRINNVQIDKAAQQVMAHIRYAQHLAMMDNQFDTNDPDWYKKRWQIKFKKSSGEWSYSIFRDIDLNSNPTITKNEIAKNPQNPSNQILSSDTISGKKITKSLNLTKQYKIKQINFSGCIGSKRIYFDYIGRPMAGNPVSLDRPYYEDDQNKIYLLKQSCLITLTDSENNKVVIKILPETGYVYSYKL